VTDANTQVQKDISKSWQAEISVLEAVFDNMNEGVVITDTEGNFQFTNPAARKMAGISDVNPAASEWQSEYGIFKTDRSTPIATEDLPLYRAMSTGAPARRDLFMRTALLPEGVFLSVVASPLNNAEGVMIGGIAVFHDITERTQIEQTVRESERLLRILVHNSPDIILLTDPKGIIRFTNTALPGIDIPQIIGTHIVDYLPTAEVEPYLNQFQSVLDSGMAGDIEIKSVDGKTWFCRTIPLANNGETNRVMVIATDVTTKRSHQEEQDRANRMEALVQVASQIAHDFNNLLSPLVAYPSLIRNALPEDSPVHDMLDDIEYTAGKIAETNRDLLTLGRAGHFESSPISLNDLVRKSVSTQKFRSDVELETKFASNLPLILGSEAQLVRVIVNLIVNAQNASDDGGTIFVGTSVDESPPAPDDGSRFTPGPHVCVTVTDTGRGIPASKIHKIFDPFFTINGSGSQPGSGLGLSVVRSGVENHGGFIKLQSKPGQGTTFRLYFPTADVQGVETAAAAADGGSESVLVADDDPIQRRVIEHLLRRLGYEVQIEDSGESAVEHARKTAFDLVILDMAMRGIDGAETHRQIREIYPEQKVLIVSGYAKTDRVKRVLKEEGTAFISKPVSPVTLAAAVRNVLDTARTETR